MVGGTWELGNATWNCKILWLSLLGSLRPHERPRNEGDAEMRPIVGCEADAGGRGEAAQVERGTTAALARTRIGSLLD